MTDQNLTFSIENLGNIFWVLRFIIDSMMKMFITVVEFERTSIKFLSHWFHVISMCMCIYMYVLNRVHYQKFLTQNNFCFID